MKRFLFVPISLFVLSFCFHQSASASIGLYVPVNNGSIVTNVDGYFWTDSHISTGFGMLFDSRVAGNRLFNFRMGLGLEYGMATGLIDFSQVNINVDPTFGFGFLRTKVVRLWAGPQVRFGLGYGFGDYDYSVVRFNMGFGAVVGANFHLSRKISLGAETGYRYVFGIGSGSVKQWYNNQDQNGLAVTGDYGVFFNFIIFFRSGEDQYEGTSKDYDGKKYKK